MQIFQTPEKNGGWNDGAYVRHEIVQFFNWFLKKSYFI